MGTIIEDVNALIGGPAYTDPLPSVPAAVAQITVMVKAYTRGRGFTNGQPNDELVAVITTASARLARNGSGVLHHQKLDDMEVEYKSSFTGWTLAELAVLNRYRVRAQ